MSKEGLTNTDSEGSVQNPGIEPYQYELYLSDAGEDQDSEGDDSSLTNEDEKGSVVDQFVALARSLKQ